MRILVNAEYAMLKPHYQAFKFIIPDQELMEA